MEDASELDTFLETWRTELDRSGSSVGLWDYSATKELFEAASKLQQHCKDLEPAMAEQVRELVSHHPIPHPPKQPPLQATLFLLKITNLTSPFHRAQKAENKTLKQDNSSLRKSNTALRTANTGLDKAVKSMTTAMKKLEGAQTSGHAAPIKSTNTKPKVAAVARVRKPQPPAKRERK